MAAGQDLEPYWEVYRQHLRGHVVDWMEGYRVGNLSPEEAKAASKSFEFGDAYETDPVRDPNLLPCTQKPFNGEPRVDLLTRDYITPNELFYVRNHLPVPEIEANEYRLIVKGKGLKKHKFTLKDLQTKFKKHEVITTLQCAGNRREDLHNERMREFLAPHWVVGAISTAKWGGVKVRDVLRECGLDVDAIALGELEIPGLSHVQFEAYDQDETGVHYGGSVPIEKAVDGLGDAIFAFEMNDEPLPRDHGYPVRAILPGHAGCRQCKWVHKVILSDKQSDKCWQQKSYRHFAPDINFEKDLAHWPPKRLDQAPISQMMPVQSIICNPPQNTVLGGKNATSVTLKGVAWSGGGREIQRVDVSIDGGKTWTAAELYKPIEQKWNHHWAWTQFYRTIELPGDIQKKLKNGEHVRLDLVSKALNSDFNVQPERMEPYWNSRGIAINHWYHVNVSCSRCFVLLLSSPLHLQ
jgi:sulfite oxidase